MAIHLVCSLRLHYRGEQMFGEIWTWLHEPGNLDILKFFGGLIATIVGGLWTFLSGIQNRRLIALWHSVVAKLTGKKAPPSRTTRTRKFARAKHLRLASFIIAGLVTVVGAVYGVMGYLDVLYTTTVQYKLCVGEYEGNCGFAHDTYLYCYADAGQWAKQRCLRYNTTSFASHDGNKCGYSGITVACTQKVHK